MSNSRRWSAGLCVLSTVAVMIVRRMRAARRGLRRDSRVRLCLPSIKTPARSKGGMDGDLSLAERDGEDSIDLFTAFFKPLQQASLASRHAKDNEVDYLDSEAGIALQWANSVGRQWVTYGTHLFSTRRPDHSA